MSWELYYDEKFSYMLGIDIFRNSAHKNIECPEGVRGDFLGFGRPKDTQMPCWLRICSKCIESCEH